MTSMRVAEIFGPTVQGEGRLIGTPCHFIRLGGCDLRCRWCDTPHAVLPELVRHLPTMKVGEIIEALNDLDSAAESSPDWIVISGGNPALWDLQFLLDAIHQREQRVMVETQGTLYKLWMQAVDDLCVSPKPPSSGNEVSIETLDGFYTGIGRSASLRSYLKVVVFDDADYDYAIRIHRAFPDIEFFVSVGNEDPSLPTVGNPNPAFTDAISLTTSIVLDKLRWLTEKITHDQRMNNVRVLPQMHTLIWGNARGK